MSLKLKEVIAVAPRTITKDVLRYSLATTKFVQSDVNDLFTYFSEIERLLERLIFMIRPTGLNINFNFLTVSRAYYFNPSLVRFPDSASYVG